jgi:hypothetical protein
MVLATHSIRQFPLHFPSRTSPCAITFQTHSTAGPRVYKQCLCGRGQLKCYSTCAETRFRLSAKASVQSTSGSRDVRTSGSNAGYTMFRGSVKTTGYPLHSPVSPSLPLPCVIMCHHISNAVYSRSTHVLIGKKMCNDLN